MAIIDDIGIVRLAESIGKLEELDMLHLDFGGTDNEITNKGALALHDAINGFDKPLSHLTLSFSMGNSGISYET